MLIHRPQSLKDHCFPRFLKGKIMTSVILKLVRLQSQKETNRREGEEKQ